ncbi:MAG: HigA family addiction module antitoxin [Cyanobacteria bacterium P01_D01_bin.123]
MSRIFVPTHRAPFHPGEILREEFLESLDVTQAQLARDIHVPFQRVNEIVGGRRGITADTALRLAKYFGMTPDFWLKLQLSYDLYYAQQKAQVHLDEIVPLKGKEAVSV